MLSPLVSDHHIQISLPRALLIAEYHSDGIIYYIVFSAFSDFNIMLCRFIYCVIYIYELLLLLMSSVLFIPLPMEGHLGYFQFGAILIKLLWTGHCTNSYFHFSWVNTYTWNSSHMISICLKEASLLFSKVATFFIPTNNAWGFTFLHSLNSTLSCVIYHFSHASSCMKVKVKVPESCPTLWDPMDCSLPGSSVHGDSWG